MLITKTHVPSILFRWNTTFSSNKKNNFSLYSWELSRRLLDTCIKCCLLQFAEFIIYYWWSFDIVYTDNDLSQFMPMFHFYTPWKWQKASGFLKFSGGRKMTNIHTKYLTYIYACVKDECIRNRQTYLPLPNLLTLPLHCRLRRRLSIAPIHD